MNFREQFPFFKQNPNWVYLDSAATTLKPQILLDTTTAFYASAGSVHRSLYDTEQSLAYEKARDLVAKRFNLRDRNGVIWTSGTTHALNLVANGLEYQIQGGDEILISIAEHHANFITWQQLALRTGAKLKVLSLNEHFLLDETELLNALSDRTKIVALNLVSNVTGVKQPIEKIISIIRQNSRAKIVLDIAQAVLHHHIDCQAIGADFYAFSAHKLYGPTGVGCLLGDLQNLDQLRPLTYGGKMLQEVTTDSLVLADLPYRLEAGTPNIAGIIGFGAVLEWLNQQNFSVLNQQLAQLAEALRNRLSLYENVQLFDNPNAISPTLSFSIAGVHHSDISAILTESQIAIRNGTHCAKPYLRYLQQQGTVRISLAHYNNQADIAYFFEKLDFALDLLT